MTAATQSAEGVALPKPGEIVQVRQRQYLVEGVTAPVDPGDCTTVTLSCVNDDAQGEPLEVLWELEPDAYVLTGNGWDALAKKGFDPPKRFSAYLHTLRWNCVTATNPRLFQAPFRAGIKIDDTVLNAALTDIAKQAGLSLADFQKKLDATPGSSYAEVRTQVKQELMIEQLRRRRMQDRIRITDQDVQNFLNSPSGKAELATEYHVAHILIGLPDQATPADIAAAQARMQKVQDELKAGKDFATVAATYSNADAAAGFVKKTISLNAYKGQTFQLNFYGVEDHTLQTSFVIDDVSLGTTP